MELNVNIDLENALSIMNGVNSNNKNYQRVFLHTNEYIKDYLSLFNVENNNVLTVMASGDQVVYSLLNGAACIDAFDTNILTKYFFELKKAAIIALTREEFLKFYPLSPFFLVMKEMTFLM